MEKKTIMSDKDLLWFLESQDDEMDNEVIPQTEAQPVPMEETTTDAEMKKDSVTQGGADIASEQSEPAWNTENVTVQRRISAKMRKKTLESYKQSFLIPIKLSNRKAVYLSRDTQERADFIGFMERRIFATPSFKISNCCGIIQNWAVELISVTGITTLPLIIPADWLPLPITVPFNSRYFPENVLIFIVGSLRKFILSELTVATMEYIVSCFTTLYFILQPSAASTLYVYPTVLCIGRKSPTQTDHEQNLLNNLHCHSFFCNLHHLYLTPHYSSH